MKLLMISVIFLISSCGGVDVEKRIAAKVAQACGEKLECSVDLSGSTSFDWDAFYVFLPGSLNSEISDVLKKEFTFSHEFSYKYVFLLNGEVVYTEEHPVNFDRIPPGAVLFSGPVGKRNFFLLYPDSRLDARIDRRKGGTSFYLTCTNCAE